MPYSIDLIQKAAQRIGATVVVEPEWGWKCLVIFKNGGRFVHPGLGLNINSAFATRISKDKDAADFVLRQAGIPTVPQSRLFLSPKFAAKLGRMDLSLEAAYEYAKEIGWPVVVKPNEGSQGVGVSLAYNKRQLLSGLRAIFKNYRKALVQKPVSGQDYRLLVLADYFVAAYHRIPLSVVGDGHSSVANLLQDRLTELNLRGRKVIISSEDKRIADKLRLQGFAADYIPEVDQKIFLLDNANLSTGGDVVDVSRHIHPEYKKIAIDVARKAGLQQCGVDLLVDGDISQKPGGNWCVLEINASPGVSHFMQIGPEQRQVIEDMYVRALKMVEASFEAKSPNPLGYGHAIARLLR